MTSTPKPARLDWVDAGRGLAILLVVSFHAANWLGAAGIPTEGWVTTNEAMATLRMPLFFVLAGLFSQKWLTVSWRTLWSSKISLFAWVFGLWTVISTFSFMLGLNLQGQNGNYLRQLVDILWAPALPRFELWFIWALFWFFIIAKLIRRTPVWLQLGVTAALSVVALSGWIEGNVGWTGAAKYLFFFLVGLLLRDQILNVSASWRTPALTAIFVVWLAVSIAGVFLGWHESIPGYYFVNAILGIGAGIGLSRLLASISMLRHVGARTLPIYLMHTTVILIAAWFLWHLPGEWKTIALGWIVVPILVALSTWVALKLAAAAAGKPPWAYAFEAPPWFQFAPPSPSKPHAQS